MSAKIKRVLRNLDLLLHQKSKLMQNKTNLYIFSYPIIYILCPCAGCGEICHTRRSNGESFQGSQQARWYDYLSYRCTEAGFEQWLQHS